MVRQVRGGGACRWSHGGQGVRVRAPKSVYKRPGAGAGRGAGLAAADPGQAGSPKGAHKLTHRARYWTTCRPLLEAGYSRAEPTARLAGAGPRQRFRHPGASRSVRRAPGAAARRPRCRDRPGAGGAQKPAGTADPDGATVQGRTALARRRTRRSGAMKALRAIRGPGRRGRRLAVSPASAGQAGEWRPWLAQGARRQPDPRRSSGSQRWPQAGPSLFRPRPLSRPVTSTNGRVMAPARRPARPPAGHRGRSSRCSRRWRSHHGPAVKPAIFEQEGPAHERR